MVKKQEMVNGKLELDWTQKPLSSIGAAHFESVYWGIANKTEAMVTMENCERTQDGSIALFGIMMIMIAESN